MFVKCLFALFAFAISAMVKLTLTYKMGKFQTPLVNVPCIRGDASKVTQLYFTRQGQLTAVIRHCSAYKTLRKVLQHC